MISIIICYSARIHRYKKADREQLMEFKRINRQNRTKPTISLRISPTTLQKAKQYGKGYTGLLSRLLDLAIDDEEMVRKCV